MPGGKKHPARVLLLMMILFAAGVAVLCPWAFRMGGRFTPGYWNGMGSMTTKSGTYLLYVFLYPASHFSHLHLDGMRPSGGLQGTATLCLGRGATQQLRLSGTIYNAWPTADHALLQFRLLEWMINPGGREGYFDLYGHWNDQQLVMNDRKAFSHAFRSGLRIEQASVTFEWGTYADFKAACASAPSPR